MCNTSLHGANNLVLAQRGTVVISPDNKAKNDGFDNVISQFDLIRADMDAGFEALHATAVRRLTQIGVITLLEMIAILCVDRWWL